MDRYASIYVAGHTGLIGSALMRRLQAEGFARIVTRPRAQLDLTRQDAVDAFFRSEQLEYVFLAAARVGGIRANATYPADFIHTNIAIQSNVIPAAHRVGVKRLLFFGSSCAYPKHAVQPMREDALLTGPLEPTSEPYATAKLAGMSMCAAYHRQYGARFVSVIPATAYGPRDNFDPEAAHVLPALLRRFHEARRANRGSVTIWGSGAPRREFLFVDDLVDACLFIMRLDENRLQALLHRPTPAVNIGAGHDIAIRDLAELIRQAVGYAGRIEFDTSQPDGAPRKQLDTTTLDQLGWRATTPLEKGIRVTYEWYQSRAH